MERSLVWLGALGLMVGFSLSGCEREELEEQGEKVKVATTQAVEKGRAAATQAITDARPYVEKAKKATTQAIEKGRTAATQAAEAAKPILEKTKAAATQAIEKVKGAAEKAVEGVKQSPKPVPAESEDDESVEEEVKP